MTKGFFDYEGKDDDAPKTYFDSRVAKAKREGTWSKPGPIPAMRFGPPVEIKPRPALITAIGYTVLAVGMLYSSAVDWLGSIALFRLAMGVLSIPMAVIWWRGFFRARRSSRRYLG